LSRPIPARAAKACRRSRGAWDFGLGAGFYVDATQPPFSRNYRMWSYLTKELPELIAEDFPVDLKRQSILGHSMGGHGALTIALSDPGRYRAASAFSPIVAPSQVPWGIKALGGYLGDDKRHGASMMRRADRGRREVFRISWSTSATPIRS
jgi:S-formylglutathione hydrolase